MRWLWNSIKIATISSLLIVAVSTTAAYAFARLKFRFKGAILNSMLLCLGAVAVSTVISANAAYAFSRMRFRGKRFIVCSSLRATPRRKRPPSGSCLKP